MEIINNIDLLLGDDLKATLRKASKISIAKRKNAVSWIRRKVTFKSNRTMGAMQGNNKYGIIW